MNTTLAVPMVENMDTSVKFADPEQEARFEAYLMNLRADEFAMALMADRIAALFPTQEQHS